MSSNRTFPTRTATATATNTGSRESKSALSSEAKVGIGVGVGVLIIVIVIVVIVMSGRKHWRRAAFDTENENELGDENEAAKIVHADTALSEGSHPDDPPPPYEDSNAEARRARAGSRELPIEHARP